MKKGLIIQYENYRKEKKVDNIIFQIQTHLKKYKAYCACERDLEMPNNEESELNFNQKKRLEEMRKNKRMIENWLSILSEEERHIIQLHLIDGKSWKRIEAEYEQKDEYEYRATRTLMRYQQQALKKIEEYVSSMVA